MISRERLAELFAEGMSMAQAARVFGVSRQRIHQIVKRDLLQPCLAHKLKRNRIGEIINNRKLLEIVYSGASRVLVECQECLKKCVITFFSWIHAGCKKCVHRKRRKVNIAHGDMFGSWCVLRESDIRTLKNNRHYYCQCRCGIIAKIQYGNLIYKKTRACASCAAIDRAVLPGIDLLGILRSNAGLSLDELAMICYSELTPTSKNRMIGRLKYHLNRGRIRISNEVYYICDP